jgi:hypothetical protein
MTTMDMIYGLIVMGIAVGLFYKWKTARAVIVESFSHPLKTSVIRVGGESDDNTPKQDRPQQEHPRPKEDEERRAGQRPRGRDNEEHRMAGAGR